jgi:mannose-6-phosphate isomerase-like protein (cupin superfamily)
MIIKGRTLAEEREAGRKPYPLTSQDVTVQHFVVRVTTPSNPFKPHKHHQREIWYVLEGEAVLNLDGVEHALEGGDLVELAPWVEHGLRTDSRVTWICIG